MAEQIAKEIIAKDIVVAICGRLQEMTPQQLDQDSELVAKTVARLYFDILAKLEPYQKQIVEDDED